MSSRSSTSSSRRTGSSQERRRTSATERQWEAQPAITHPPDFAEALNSSPATPASRCSEGSEERPWRILKPKPALRSVCVGIHFALHLRRATQELVANESQHTALIERIALALQNPTTERASAWAIFKKFAVGCDYLPESNWDPLLRFLSENWHLPDRFHNTFRSLIRKCISGHNYILPTSINFDQFCEVWLMMLRRVRDALCGARISRKSFISVHTTGSVESSESGSLRHFEQKYTKVRRLGEGSFAVCWHVVDKTTNVERVAKILHKKTVSIPIEEMCSELEVLKTLDHANVVRVFECFETGESIAIIIDYAAGGDLKMYMQDHAEMTALGGTTIGFACNALLQCMDALVYMHFTKKIVHRDLKLANILLMTPPNVPPHVALADFGLALVFSSIDSLSGHCQGTLAYMAPEVFAGEFSVRSDIWSMGVCAFEMLTGKRPFVADNPMHLYNLIRQDGGIDWGEYFDPKRCHKLEPPLEEAMRFAQILLKHDPNQRPDAKTVRAHPWLTRCAHDRAAFDSNNDVRKLRGTLSLGLRTSHFSKTVLACIVAGAPVNVLRKMSVQFAELDSEGTGLIPVDDLARTLQELIGYTQEEARMIAMSLDTDMSGKVSYSEFLAGACNLKKKRLDSLLSSAFSVFDSDGDGKLSVEELRHATLGDGGNSLATKIMPDGLSFDELLVKIDVNKNGIIEFDEFREYILTDLENSAKDVCGEKFRFDSTRKTTSTSDSFDESRVSVNSPLQHRGSQSTTGHLSVSVTDHHGYGYEAPFHVQVANDDQPPPREVEEKMPHLERAYDGLVPPPSKMPGGLAKMESVSPGANCVPVPAPASAQDEKDRVPDAQEVSRLSASQRQNDVSTIGESTSYISPHAAARSGGLSDLALLIVSLQDDIRRLSAVLHDGIAGNLAVAEGVVSNSSNAAGVPQILPNQQTTKDNAPVTISSTFKDAAVGTTLAAPHNPLPSNGEKTALIVTTATSQPAMVTNYHETGTAMAYSDVSMPLSPTAQTAVTDTAFLSSSTLTQPPRSPVRFAECRSQSVGDDDGDSHIIPEHAILNECGECKKQSRELLVACRACQKVRCNACYAKHFCEYCGCVDDHVVCPTCLERTILHKVCRRSLKVCVDCCRDVCGTTCYQSHRCISGVSRQACAK